MILRSIVSSRVLDVEVADQLLGDRRGALDRLAAGLRGPSRRRGRCPAGRARRGRRSSCPRSRPWRPSASSGSAFGGDRLADVVRADEPDQAAVGGVDRRGAALLHRLQARERRRRVVDVDRPGGGDPAGDERTRTSTATRDRRSCARGDGACLRRRLRIRVGHPQRDCRERGGRPGTPAFRARRKRPACRARIGSRRAAALVGGGEKT